jgi:hypothetical protein
VHTTAGARRLHQQGVTPLRRNGDMLGTRGRQRPALLFVFDATKGLIMGFFSNILEKLGMKEAAAAPVITPPAAAAAPAPAAAPAAPVAAAAPAVQSITMVDVVALLTEKAAANPEKLNWKTSIVDLLKLLGLDSSLTARKELAKELYCPDEKMADSAQMNMWLHKNVLAHIAANGGNIPEELL